MTGGQILLNLLFAALGFFLSRWILGIIFPDEMRDKEKVVTIIAVIVAVVVFFLNLSVNIHS